MFIPSVHFHFLWLMYSWYSFFLCDDLFKNAWDPRAFIGAQPDSLCSQTCMVLDKHFGFCKANLEMSRIGWTAWQVVSTLLRIVLCCPQLAPITSWLSPDYRSSRQPACLRASVFIHVNHNSLPWLASPGCEQKGFQDDLMASTCKTKGHSFLSFHICSSYFPWSTSQMPPKEMKAEPKLQEFGQEHKADWSAVRPMWFRKLYYLCEHFWQCKVKE